MPNWCMNVVTFENDDEALLHRLVDAFNNGATMNEFWPCPQELRDTVAGSLGANTPEQAELEKKQRDNVAKYGFAHWYDWCCENWGVKWDFGRNKSEGDPKAEIKEKDGKKYVELSFSSAWAPPLGFYAHLHEHFGFRIKAYYFEPGMGFIGTSRGGEENTINIREMTQDWLAENVPEKLCQVFNLYEYAAQCEEAEQEFNDNE